MRVLERAESPVRVEFYGLTRINVSEKYCAKRVIILSFLFYCHFLVLRERKILAQNIFSM